MIQLNFDTGGFGAKLKQFNAEADMHAALIAEAYQAAARKFLKGTSLYGLAQHELAALIVSFGGSENV